jgi:hypothetical protein
MLPSLIQRKLWGLRLWEACLRLLWGAARCLVVFLALLALACALDWLIDHLLETPWLLRVALLGGQLLVAAVLVLWLVVLPLFVRLSNSHLALLVEDREPKLHHRLISVVQFHQPGAQLEGMSRELIDRVTRETKEQVAGMNFVAKANARRLLWGLCWVTPALLLALGLFLVWPETVWALVQRQFLANVPIPRSIYLENISDEVWPRGEEVVLRFRVRGSGVASLTTGEAPGFVVLDPEDQPSESYPLHIESIDHERGEAVAVVTLPPSYTNAAYGAWLLDGRLPQPGQVRYEPRPVIESIHAWAVLPGRSYGMHPVSVALPRSGSIYPVSCLACQFEFPRAEVVAVEGWSARVTIRVQKPIKKATLQLLGPTPLLKNPVAVAGTVGWAATGFLAGGPSLLPSAAGAVRSAEHPTIFFGGYETILRTIPMNVLPEGDVAQTEPFVLLSGASGYRLIVEDEYKFKNIPAPRRGIRFVPEEAPQVALLPERMPAGTFDEDSGRPEEDSIDGAPVPAGKRFLIAYNCRGPFGLGTAQLHFRVLKKAALTSEGSPETVETTPWIRVPLQEKMAAPDSGRFDPKLGAFTNSDLKKEEIEFHAVPTVRPQRWLGRLEGGGRFALKLKELPDGKGGFFEPRPGDQIEFFIEVFASRDIYDDRPRAVSEVRIKSVVTPLEAGNWIGRALDEERRIRMLEQKQKGVFGFQ